MELIVWLVVSALLGGRGGVVIGRLAVLRWYRMLLLAGWMFAPIIAWSAYLATGEPSPPGYWSWWRVSMVYLAVPLGCWVLSALIGYRNSVRDRSSVR